MRPLHYSEGGRANIRTREGVQLFEREREGLTIRGREGKILKKGWRATVRTREGG